MIDVNIDLYGFALNVKRIALLSNTYQIFVLCSIDLDVVKVVLFCPWVLFEEDELRVGVSDLSEEILKNMCVFQAHPMSTFLMNAAVISLKSTVLSTQFMKFLNVCPREVVSFIGAVLSSDLNRKSEVSDIVQLNLIGMSCHHGCACEPICHSGSHVVDAVSSCRVSGDEYFVGIYEVVEEEAPDDNGKEFLEVVPPPHVPLVFAGSRNEPNYALRKLVVVEVQVVVVLLVVDLGRTAASTVEAEDEGVSVFGFIAADEVLKSHRFISYGYRAALQQVVEDA
jgi:hypothetical protein